MLYVVDIFFDKNISYSVVFQGLVERELLPVASLARECELVGNEPSLVFLTFHDWLHVLLEPEILLKKSNLK